MSWPGPIDYHEALQHPERVFRDPDLRRGRVASNRRGMPAVRAGGFALVYKLLRDADATAVRVFLYPSSERADRYKIIHRYLQAHRPGCLVDFGYQPEGVRIGRDGFPLQTMTWVEGDTLGNWMARAVDRRDASRLRRMADQWVRLVEELASHRIAHGDLQHGNVLIMSGDRPILVDYDGVCVPDLAGRPAQEVGLPAYQHPERARQPLGPDLDRFSAWIIWLALRAVAVDAPLWTRFVVAVENENLLFSEADIATPDRSALWKALAASPDRDVRVWSGRIRDAIGRPFDRIPPFRPDASPPSVVVVNPTSRDRAQTGLPATAVFRGETRFPTDAKGHSDESRRVEAIESLRRFPSALTLANDQAFLDLWNRVADALGSHVQAEPFRRRATECRSRLALHRRFVGVPVNGGEVTDQEILDAARELPEGYDPAWRQRLDSARQRLSSRAAAVSGDVSDHLLDLLRAGNHAAFLERVDLEILAAAADRFRPYRPVIEKWMREHILRSRPVESSGEPPRRVGRTLIVPCRWSHSRLVRTCRIALASDSESPGSMPRTRRVEPAQARRAGGLVVAIPAGARRLRLSIEPLIDLGWTELRGAAWTIGPIDLEAIADRPRASPTPPRGSSA